MRSKAISVNEMIEIYSKALVNCDIAMVAVIILMKSVNRVLNGLGFKQSVVSFILLVFGFDPMEPHI